MWTSNGIELTTASFNQGVDYGTEAVPSFAITTDAAGGAILAWPDGRAIPCAITVGRRECDVYAQRVSDQVGAAPTADLSVQMSASPSPAPLGSNVTFTITITNNGPNTAEGVNLLDSFPALGSFVSMTTSQGACLFSAGFMGPLCGLGPLSSGSKATVTLLMGTTDSPGTYTNGATVYSGENDLNTADNTTSASDTVAVDFTLAAAPGSDTVATGQSATYTITLTPLVAILSDTVTLSCSGLPPESSCTFSPPTFVPGANPTNSALTVSTTGPSAALHRVAGGRPFFFAFALPLLGLSLAGIGRHRRLGYFGGMLVIVFFLVLPGCGSGGAGYKNSGTPPGQYTFTVTAATPSLTHTTQVKLIVQ